MSIAAKTIAKNSMLTRIAAVCLVFGVAGLSACASQPPRLQPVNVAVPVPCQQTVPVRPVMPTESLNPGVTLDRFAAAAIAEIERREGYEGELRAALTACVGEVTGGAR